MRSSHVLILLSACIAIGCGRDKVVAPSPSSPYLLPEATFIGAEPEDLQRYASVKGGPKNLAGAYSGLLEHHAAIGRREDGTIGLVRSSGTRHDVVLLPDGQAYFASFRQGDSAGGLRLRGMWAPSGRDALVILVKNFSKTNPTEAVPARVTPNGITLWPDSAGPGDSNSPVDLSRVVPSAEPGTKPPK